MGQPACSEHTMNNRWHDLYRRTAHTTTMPKITTELIEVLCSCAASANDSISGCHYFLSLPLSHSLSLTQPFVIVLLFSSSQFLFFSRTILFCLLPSLVFVHFHVQFQHFPQMVLLSSTFKVRACFCRFFLPPFIYHSFLAAEICSEFVHLLCVCFRLCFPDNNRRRKRTNEKRKKSKTTNSI